jgi:putative ATP-binding cassette transporter
MYFLHLLHHVGRVRQGRVVLLALAAAILQAGMFLVAGSYLPTLKDLHAFAPLGAALLLLALYMGVQSVVIRQIYHMFEDGITAVRANIFSLLATSELSVVRAAGIREIRSIVAEDARVVAAQLPTIAISLCFSALALVCLSVLAWESVLAAGVLVALILGAHLYRGRFGDTERFVVASQRPEAALRKVLDDMLLGVRDIVVDREKAGAIATAFGDTARDSSVVRKMAAPVFGLSLAVVEGSFAFSIVAVYQLTQGLVPGTVVTIDTLLLVAFATGPVKRLLYVRYELRAAAQAARRLVVLEAALAAAPRVAQSAVAVPPMEVVALDGVSFTHAAIDDRGAFTVGPATLQIQRGMVVLVKGSNGAGKSTLLDMLVGLLKPSSGTLLVNGEPVSVANLESYRRMFSIVPAEPHLFDQLYGYGEHGRAVCEEWMRFLQLPEGLAVDSGQEATFALSKGQRKRLALARAMMEERPIVILDEYAADQDPEARQRYYTDVLPRLKAEGKTIIAVVHDDVDAIPADLVVSVTRGHVEAVRTGALT